MLGLKKGEVKLSEFDEIWAISASDKIDLLKRILSDLIIDIQHVGSTSVFNMVAKPIVDIAILIENLDELNKYISVLDENGFVYKKENDEGWQRFFYCNDGNKNEIVTHHIHFIDRSTNRMSDYIAFRDFLNANSKRKKEYINLKRDLAKKYEFDRLGYTQSKTHFIQKTIKEANQYLILGSEVRVTIDRPIGSLHPQYKNVYELNYGYVDGVLGCDGEFQDAYIIGVSDKLDSFTGVVVAIIDREDDIETKWVVAPKNYVVYEPEIIEKTNFIEQYFKSKYICLFEKSCGAVMFTKIDGEIRYLLIKNRSGHYGLAKGHTELGETEKQTAIREIKEETNLDVKIIDGFKECVCYNIYTVVQKEVVYFLGEFNSEDIHKIKLADGEISDYKLINYCQAEKLVTYEIDRSVLKKANIKLNN